MNLHEYQAKQLFSDYGVQIPSGLLANSTTEAIDAANTIGGEAWVVKAQVHAGGRGKVGGVRLVKNQDELRAASDDLLGSFLKTKQTVGEGLPINSLLIEQTLDIKRELYLSLLVDREKEQLVFVVSVAGGMNIEEVAETNPEKIIKVFVTPGIGLHGYQCRQAGFALGLEGKQINSLTKIMQSLHKLFVDRDLSLLEINPLVVTASGELVALDAKMNIDDNAVMRHPALAEMRDTSQEDEAEVEAQKHDLNYITLDGTIGCMVNGAGLAMATMDLIKLHGAEPANFLDVGGTATAERVEEAFKIILKDSKVKAILVNIFGGIVRCNLIAEGIVEAAKSMQLTIPVVVRLEGTNVNEGKEILQQSGLDIVAAEGLTDAASKVVSATHNFK